MLYAAMISARYAAALLAESAILSRLVARVFEVGRYDRGTLPKEGLKERGSE